MVVVVDASVFEWSEPSSETHKRVRVAWRGVDAGTATATVGKRTATSPSPFFLLPGRNRRSDGRGRPVPRGSPSAPRGNGKWLDELIAAVRCPEASAKEH